MRAKLQLYRFYGRRKLFRAANTVAAKRQWVRMWRRWLAKIECQEKINNKIKKNYQFEAENGACSLITIDTLKAAVFNFIRGNFSLQHIAEIFK